MLRTLTRTDAEIARLFGSLDTPNAVADLLEVDYATLSYHLYRASTGSRYKMFRLKKRTGGFRQIRAPHSALKILQEKLNRILQVSYTPRNCVHGFVANRSLVSNARPHVRAQWVLNIDLEDFFPSINFGRVRGIFAAAPFNLPLSVATVIAQLACHDNQLPQGAPSSPAVANLVAAKMDGDLKRLAAKHDCRYTRYADDLTFSTYRRKFPPELACFVSRGIDVFVGVGDECEAAIIENGFSVRSDKVHLMHRTDRQVVAGITVNERLNVPRTFVRQIRAMLHAWTRFSYAAAESEFRQKYDGSDHHPGLPRKRFTDVVKGKIAFLAMVRGNQDPLVLRFWEKYNALERTRTESEK